jgi:hypothetical protein
MPHFRSSTAVLMFAVALLAAGCSRDRSPNASEPVVDMGSPIAAGPLTYTIIDQRWHDSLSASTGNRLPKHRFFSVQVTVTNGGSEQAGVPLLSLIGSDGATYQEETNGDGLTGWLGYIRLLNPVQTEHGRILFDVPPGAYQLRVSSGGEPESEITALVRIPFQVEAPSSVGEESMAPTK